MLTKRFIPPTVLSLVMFFSISTAHADLAAEMKMLKSAKMHKPFIENFARLLRDKKEHDILAALDPASIDGVNPAQILEAFERKIFPYFEKYEKITKAKEPDGRIGLWHYTYIIDSKGNTIPFHIAIIDAGGELKVLNIAAGECVKDRHPPIPRANNC